MNATTQTRRETLLHEVERIGNIPSVEGIVLPLIGYLQQPLESLDMQRVVDLISHDNSLAAQCLHMANSPLFGRWQAISTTRGAVIALGLQRMRDIAMSCCLLKLMPADANEMNPVVIWEHSLACALVCRRIAKRIGMSNPEQAYLAGLLHDIGFVVNLRVAPKDFYELWSQASQSKGPLEELEQEQLGFTHGESGQILARNWGLAPDVVEVIGHHHQMSALDDNPELVALISLGDRLCRSHGLGYGFAEKVAPDWVDDEAVNIVRAKWPAAAVVNWAKFSVELDSYLTDVKKLVSVLYRFKS